MVLVSLTRNPYVNQSSRSVSQAPTATMIPPSNYAFVPLSSGGVQLPANSNPEPRLVNLPYSKVTNQAKFPFVRPVGL